MTSGVSVSDTCVATFEDIKKKKTNRYIVFFINEDQKIDIEAIGERGATYENFLEHLKQGDGNQCRYGLFDYEYQHQHQGTTDVSLKEKLVLMLWCPDTAKVQQKMLYSSSFKALQQSLVGIQKYIQANDESEASMEEVEEQLRATDRS